jgi:pectate lyase
MPSKRVLAAAGAAVTVVLVVGGARLAFADTTLFSDNFESGSTSNWSKSGGTWAVATDGSKVFAQSNAGSENAREFAGSTSWTDYAVQARVKALSFGSGGLAGLDARVESSTKFYRLALLSGRAELQEVNGSSVSVLGSTSGVSAGTWYTVKISVAGNSITGSLNGTQFASASNSVHAAGRVGLQTAFASASFDDVVVTSSAGGGGTPTPTVSPTRTTSPTPTPTGSGGTGTPPAGVSGFATVNGTTTGGSGGGTVTVTSLSALISAASASTTQTVRVSGNFTCSDDVRVASNKTIVGVGASSGLTGCGLNLRDVNNVIVQNMKIAKVEASHGNGDAIHIDGSTHLWIDHNDLSSDTTHGTDFYDGLLDITHAADLITVSWNYLHDHIKCSLIGHSDNNGSEDTGHLRVTYHHNYFNNCDQRMPSLRFGTGHVYNNYFVNGTTGVHSRMGAQMLVQNNVWRNVDTPIETTKDSDVDGFVNQSGNDFGGGTNLITQTGTFTNPPYSFSLTATSSVISVVTAGAGTGKIS